LLSFFNTSHIHIHN